jgi:uracil-DNA glycosylase
LEGVEPLPEGWEDLFETNYHLLEHIQTIIDEKGNDFYPESENVFRAHRLCHPNKIKVIIIGQDPYFEGSANGLAFSVSEGCKIPPSLKNIFKVIKTTLQRDSICAKDGDLTRWAEQGVFLLNASLTATPGKAGGFKRVWDGWTLRTLAFIFKNAENNDIVEDLEEEEDGDDVAEEKSDKDFLPITILLGRDAQAFKKYVTGPVLESSHPSPLGAHHGFMDCNIFNETNDILARHGLKKIIW